MANNVELLRQALAASESSIKLAKQILNDIEKGNGDDHNKKVAPGVLGVYDGENMITESGEKHLVPANYASKSMLIVGDTLKLVNEKGDVRFKQIEHVKRYKTKGVLTKKDGKFHVVAPEGSYKVLPAAVDHFNSAVGGELNIWIPAKNLTAPWAAIDSTSNKDLTKEPAPKKEPTLVKSEKKDESKAEDSTTKAAKGDEKKEDKKEPVTKENTKTKQTITVKKDDKKQPERATPLLPKETAAKPVALRPEIGEEELR